MNQMVTDPRALRDAFGAFMTGVTVVTALDEAGAPVGFTANSFASVSLDPPLLLVCLAKTSRNYATFAAGRGFAVNILSERQKDVSNTFARPVEDRFAVVGWRPGPHGSPVLDDVAAWFDCATERAIEAGDHVVLVGRVEAFANAGLNGLGYARGSYFTAGLEARGVGAAAEGDTVLAAVAERDGEVLLVERPGGRWGLPQCGPGGAEPVQALAAHLAALTGLQPSVGFLFSAYSDRGAGKQHIVYRAGLSAGAPQGGRFFALDGLPLDRLDTPQTGDILRRFAAESSIGNFGIYFGNETAGQVHPLPARG